jgi:hypothetical protein
MNLLAWDGYLYHFPHCTFSPFRFSLFVQPSEYLQMEENQLSIQFLGTGGAFDVHQGNSSAIVHHQGARYLIDCGHSVFPQLVKLGLATAIDGIFITHLHDDHAGSLSTLALYHSIILQKGPIKLYYPTESLKREIIGFLSFSLQDPSKHVDFRPISEVAGAGFIDTFGRHVPGMLTYAFYFSNGRQSIVYSGDNGDANFLFGELDKLALPQPTVFHELFFFGRLFAHAYYADLIPWAERYRIYGYHCDPQFSPPDNPIPLVIHHPEFLAKAN